MREGQVQRDLREVIEGKKVGLTEVEVGIEKGQVSTDLSLLQVEVTIEDQEASLTDHTKVVVDQITTEEVSREEISLDLMEIITTEKIKAVGNLETLEGMTIEVAKSKDLKDLMTTLTEEMKIEAQEHHQSTTLLQEYSKREGSLQAQTQREGFLLELKKVLIEEEASEMVEEEAMKTEEVSDLEATEEASVEVLEVVDLEEVEVADLMMMFLISTLSMKKKPDKQLSLLRVIC